jgi:hypothetical protein
LSWPSCSAQPGDQMSGSTGSKHGSDCEIDAKGQEETSGQTRVVTWFPYNLDRVRVVPIGTEIVNATARVHRRARKRGGVADGGGGAANRIIGDRVSSRNDFGGDFSPPYCWLSPRPGRNGICGRKEFDDRIPLGRRSKTIGSRPLPPIWFVGTSR